MSNGMDMTCQNLEITLDGGSNAAAMLQDLS